MHQAQISPPTAPRNFPKCLFLGPGNVTEVGRKCSLRLFLRRPDPGKGMLVVWKKVVSLLLVRERQLPEIYSIYRAAWREEET